MKTKPKHSRKPLPDPVPENVERMLAEIEKSKQKRTETALRGRMQAMAAEIERLQTEANLASVLPDVRPMPFPIRESSNRHEAVAVQIASDWHVDEVVDKAALNGLNEFCLAIARERAKALFQGTLDILVSYKGYSDVRTLVLALLGDFMSGWIHEELADSNSLAPTEALIEVLNMLTGGIDFLLASGAVENIVCVCAVGNHARITQKMPAKGRAVKSYEYLVYRLLQNHYANEGDNRVRVQCPAGYFNYLPVLGRILRCHHGDGIKYHGGVGGVHIPLKKAIAQWNKAKWADIENGIIPLAKQTHPTPL